MSEGSAVNGRSEGLWSKCYGSLFPSEFQNAIARESPLTETALHLDSCLREESASVGESSSLTPLASESSVEALRCAFKSLKELNNYWLLALQDPTPFSYCANVYGKSTCARHCVFGDTALGLLNKKKMFLSINPSHSDFPISISEMGQGSSNTLGMPSPWKRLKNQNKQLRGTERKQKQCREERSSSKTLSWGPRSGEPFHPRDNSRRLF